MKELEWLYEGLLSSSMMLIQEADTGLECSFLKIGIVHRIVLVKDAFLAQELRQAGLCGIVEGDKYFLFKNTFNSFALRVKAKKLYLELRFSLKAAEARREEVKAA